ncbi:MAG: threonine--tRNA ligase [Deltaproteobacteria bacterium CG_4_8_14_3_um_filter_51_11]|nr:threonine--tRNA ligase [bacterium]OIP41633.1 MAG: threonine--tRNA ligase [Desulfobacteraceae bacterium CG2_30_51_40]PIP45924.1 MAG: threonine--tRNA ligase [Deltaproteobacteria bacterium CG23_combo_of_CG06-09_8_20_14_all_51_20]PIX19191.1 MAG: threonine--tRNA ligase [Deltaproteobacteria bacterium CG_4_8_14_3_um_filter_51_11]PIY25921.1 MAG: threonine--tRNA ligase [Deltaproteobacteria bacterium CG_4_10_14_3_um_filter_51_14]PJB39052.1 MAG: threonine--tRNA ligase [Deltaproteobacteria bacterium CG
MDFDKENSDSLQASAVSAKAVLSEKGTKAMERIVAVKIGDNLIDIGAPVDPVAEIKPVYLNSPEGLVIMRHSTSHVMAMAVRELFPGVKVTIGPAIEDGFYYDFDYERSFREDDLAAIEEKMKEIIKANLPFQRTEMPRLEALAFFEKAGEKYKAEIISEIDAEKVSLYTQGNFTDLCRGPHIPSTGMIKAFRLTRVAGAYWRGDERRGMLSRIYGVAFADKKDLKEYLHRIEEARKRNHVKLGAQLELFSTHEEVGAGLVIWHPNGCMLRHIIEDFEIREHLKRGYQLVKGPEILKTELWKASGHFDNYRENMYFTVIDEQSYGIKPMNCLAHMLIYRSKIRSYRDLPKRYFELGTVHRHERSGVLNGLLRVREFTQDDAHILCTPEQLNAEIIGVLDFVRDVMGIFRFDYELELSTRPEKSIGSDSDWELATGALENALKESALSYDVNEGDGAFYGPKIDVKLKDALSRKWQCATIQCDFTLPERFDLHFVDKDGERKRPVMIHRVILGAVERFIGVLIEHYAGAFPVWLSPVQAVLLTVTDRNVEWAEKAYKALLEADIRVESDFRNEKLGFKVREAQLKKIPYMLIVGDKESEEQGVAPRLRSGENLPFTTVEEVIARISDDCKQRR